MRAVERSGACNASVSWYRGNASLRCNQLNPHAERSEHPVIRQVGDQAGCSVVAGFSRLLCQCSRTTAGWQVVQDSPPWSKHTPQIITLGLSSYWV